jgi:hypothetical protein
MSQTLSDVPVPTRTSAPPPVLLSPTLSTLERVMELLDRIDFVGPDLTRPEQLEYRMQLMETIHGSDLDALALDLIRHGVSSEASIRYEQSKEFFKELIRNKALSEPLKVRFAALLQR